MLVRRVALGCAASLSLCGCADDLSSSDGTGDTGAVTATSTGDATVDIGETGTGEGDTADGESGPVDLPPLPARGITVSAIEANQAVAVPIFAAGALVSASDRIAPLVRERNTLIRAFYELDADFEPREITAKLTLNYADGTSEVAFKTDLIEADSIANDFDTTPYFLIPGELIVPETTYQIELFEVDQALLDTPEPSVAPVYPPEPAFLGIETPPMVLRVTIVPVLHAVSDACTEAPEVDETIAAYLEDSLYQQNPVQAVELTVREPFTYEAGLSSFFGLLAALAELRDSDGAAPDQYYYGVVRPCDGGPDSVGGQAIDIPSFPTVSNGWSRTAVGRFYGSPSSTANTFVHEIGHTQGRYHVTCSGTEGGPDPSYPYEGGVIGVWGFGVLDFTAHSPTTGKDYMTYCGNTWVSDWGWNEIFPFIQEISSWGLEGAPASPEGAPALVGLIDPEHDEEAWFVTTADPAQARRTPAPLHSVQVQTGRSTLSLPTTVNAIGDGGAYNLVAPLPAGFRLDTVDRLTHGIGDERRAIRRVLAGESSRDFPG